jgi:ABC-2 type transport system permease protein
MRAAVVRRIAGAELRLQRRDGRVRIAALLVATLTALAILLGYQHHAAVARAMEAAQRETQAQFVGQGEKNPHSGAHFGIHAYRPEPALGFFDRGLDDYLGVAIFIEPHHPNRFRDLPAQDETALSRFGQWTGAGMLQVLLPLLLILLAAPAIASERERGTLRLLAAQGVRPGELLCGKALGIAAAVAGVLAPALLAALAVALASPARASLSAARVALLLVGYALYLGAFLLASLAISARARTAQGAVVAALSLWSLTVLLGPRLVAEAAGRLAPSPTAFDFQQALDAGTLNHDEAAREAHDAELLRRTLAQYGVSKADDLPVNLAGIRLQDQEDHDAPHFDRVYGELFGTFAAQERLTTWGALAAPLLAVQSVSMAAAGTDGAHAADFWLAAERHRRTMVTTLNRFITAHPVKGGAYGLTADREAWDLVPPFAYAPPPARFALDHALAPLAVLLAWLLAALGACALAARSPRLGGDA